MVGSSVYRAFVSGSVGISVYLCLGSGLWLGHVDFKFFSCLCWDVVIFDDSCLFLFYRSCVSSFRLFPYIPGLVATKTFLITSLRCVEASLRLDCPGIIKLVGFATLIDLSSL